MLTVNALNQYYGGSHTLRDVAFEAPSGAVTAILGRNGVGKTTLLNASRACCRRAPARIGFDGTDVTKLPPHARARLGLGYVPQGREIFPRLTVEENLKLGLATQPARRADSGAHLRDVPGAHGHAAAGAAATSPAGSSSSSRSAARSRWSRSSSCSTSRPRASSRRSSRTSSARSARLAAEGEMAILLVEQYYDFARSLADRYVVLSRGEVIKAGKGADMDADGVRACLTV